ncbi:MAG: hypothetical protein HY078_09815 [Elusimicrobia bacterium]|nr:hypothetical protein [Elusimicrobiota bacterium]
MIRRVALVFLSLPAALLLFLFLGDRAIERLLPPKKVAAICVRELSARLHREVRVEEAGFGLWRGLWMAGLAVSESPDFSAGMFLEADRVIVKPSYAPLVSGRVAAGEVVLMRPRIHIVRRRDGTYSHSDLAGAMDLAASTATAAGQGNPRLEALLRSAVAALRLEMGEARIHQAEVVYADAASSLTLALTDGEAVLKEVRSGGRTDARTSFKVRGASGGRQFAADVLIKARLRLKDYVPIESAGSVVVERAAYPRFRSDTLRVEWDFTVPDGRLREAAEGFTPLLSSVEGVMSVEGGPGELSDPSGLAKESRWAALALYPVDVLARFRGLDLPSLEKIEYGSMRGVYSFKAGSVNIAPLYIRGPLLGFNAEGVVQMRRRTVGLKANLGLGTSAVGVLIKGPLDKPEIVPDVSFKASGAGPLATIEQKLGRP